MTGSISVSFTSKLQSSYKYSGLLIYNFCILQKFLIDKIYPFVDMIYSIDKIQLDPRELARPLTIKWLLFVDSSIIITQLIARNIQLDSSTEHARPLRLEEVMIISSKFLSGFSKHCTQFISDSQTRKTVSSKETFIIRIFCSWWSCWKIGPLPTIQFYLYLVSSFRYCLHPHLIPPLFLFSS